MRNYFLLFILLFLFGCNADSENDASKRNADWVWWVDEHTGKGEWIKSGDHTTVKDGKYTMFYYNGNVYSKGRLKNGVAIDTIYGYDLNGNLDCYDVIVSKEQRDFYAINNGPFLKLFPDGKKAFEGFVINHKTGNYWKIFNKNGILIHETNFVDSPRFTAKYFDNGKLKLKLVGDVHYIDSFHNWNINNGLRTDYYNNGNIQRELWVVDAKMSGLFKEYYENGNLENEVNLANGKENGIAKEYYENGGISAIANYKDGVLDEKLITFDSLGKNLKEYFFKNGVEIKQ